MQVIYHVVLHYKEGLAEAVHCEACFGIISSQRKEFNLILNSCVLEDVPKGNY